MMMMLWHSLLLLLLGVNSLVCVEGLKHSFYMKDDDRTLVGPVGVPFGFLKGGVFDITVSDFKLISTKSMKGRKKGWWDPRKGAQEEEVKTTGQDENTRDFEAGFFLARFENEASFNQYMEYLATNTSRCAFEYYRDDMTSFYNYGADFMEDDEFFGIDDEFEGVGDYQTAANGLLVSMDNQLDLSQNVKHFDYEFEAGEEGLYFLIYQVCPADDERINFLESSFELDFHFRNVDALGHVSYLTAGELHLPLMYFFFTFSYGICTFLWLYNIYLIVYKKQPGIFEKENDEDQETRGKDGYAAAAIANNHLPLVYPIHKLMGLLLAVRAFATFLECVRYHYIKITGHAEAWTFLYYLVAFIKGSFLFTIILLIGSGWSSMKPFLNEKERNIIFVVLFFQVANQMVLAVLSQEEVGERKFDKYTALFHIIDIICCCAVLLPIVWQVDALEKSVQYTNADNVDDEEQDGAFINEHGDQLISKQQPLSNGDLNGDDDDDEDEGDDKIADKSKIIERLKLFRSFYLLVVAYIYSTRILVYLFMTMLDYRHLWLKDFITETLTLAFYVVTGLQFRPMKMEILQKPGKATPASMDDDTITESELEMMVAKEPKNKPKPKPKTSSKEQD